MAISILNEFTGALLSPFMRPVLYFKVSGAGSVTNPTAEIEFNGTTEDVTFDAVFLETVATEHYFSVDLSDVMKYLIQTFDGENHPDDLEFINGDRLQLFDEYFRSLTIDIYFERGTANEQTLAQSNYWIYLAEQMPTQYGFYLINVEQLGNFQSLKWSKNTYNAIFFWQGEEGGLAITKGVTSLINNIASWTNVSFPTFTSSQYNIISAINSSGYVCALTNIMSVTAGDSIRITCNLTLNSGVAPRLQLVRSVGSVNCSNVIVLLNGNNDITLTSTYTGIVRLWMDVTEATNFSLSHPHIVYHAGWYQLKFSKSLTQLSAGINQIDINTATGDNGTVYIDYDPDCADVFNLCWQHPTLGYVSYPFRGAKSTTVSAKKTTELEKFHTTMINQNSLKEIMGYDITKKLTLTTKANDEYWPLLEYLYSSRHVYLFVGATGANDTKGTWVECEVSGTYSTRSNRIRGEFSVTLTLPEQFNISF